jgi:hypothetical protein
LPSVPRDCWRPHSCLLCAAQRCRWYELGMLTYQYVGHLPQLVDRIDLPQLVDRIIPPPLNPLSLYLSLYLYLSISLSLSLIIIIPPSCTPHRFLFCAFSHRQIAGRQGGYVVGGGPVLQRIRGHSDAWVEHQTQPDGCTVLVLHHGFCHQTQRVTAR